MEERKKLIKKYQQPWGSGIQPASPKMDWNNLNEILGNTAKSLDKDKKMNMYPSFGKPDSPKTLPSFKIEPAKIKPIGSALTEDAARIQKATDAAGTATKAANAAKFASGMSVATQLVDPLLQVGEGIATNLGATFAEKDAASSTVDVLSTGLGMIGPWGQAAGIALKGLDFLDRAAGKNVKGFQGNTGLSAYTDFSTQGKKFRATQRGKAKGLETSKKEGQQFYGNAMQIKGQQEQLKTGAVDLAQQSQFNKMKQLGGIDTTRGLLAKKGTKLQLLNIKARANYNHSKKQELKEVIPETIEEVDSFANGGAFNVIPEGALHAHKHSIEDENEEMTKKGIPVITIEEGGKIQQHAEIERNEITFHLAVSKQLEDLNKKYKEGDDSAALEAGKLLVYEILENTQDNTGLLNTIE